MSSSTDLVPLLHLDTWKTRFVHLLPQEIQTVFQGTPSQQATQLEQEARVRVQTIQHNLVVLGYLLVEGANRALYTFLHYDDMQTWENAMSIAPGIADMARRLYRLLPFLLESGLSYEEITQAELDKVKLQYLLGQFREAQEELRTRTDELTKAATQKEDRPLSDEERHAFYTRAFDQLRPAIHQGVQAILNTPTPQLIEHSKQATGKVVSLALPIHVHVDQQTQELVGTFRIPWDREAAEQLATGKVRPLWYGPESTGAIDILDLSLSLPPPQQDTLVFVDADEDERTHPGGEESSADLTD